MTDKQGTETQEMAVSQRQVKRFATILAAALWLTSFALNFVIPAGSHYIFLSDCLLLLGFIPLLCMWKPVWPWLVFGGLNILCGFVLQVSDLLPDTLFTATVIKLKQHLAQYHDPMIWIKIGLGSLLYGLIRVLGGGISRLRSKKN